MSLGPGGTTLLITGIVRLDSAGPRLCLAATIDSMPSVGTNSARSAGPDVQPRGRCWMRWLPGLNTVAPISPSGFAVTLLLAS